MSDVAETRGVPIFWDKSVRSLMTYVDGPGFASISRFKVRKLASHFDIRINFLSVF